MSLRLTRPKMISLTEPLNLNVSSRVESMTNADIFSAFASQLFPVLYESFPLPVKLPKQNFVDELESQSELWDLKQQQSMVIGMAELLEAAGKMTPENRAKAEHRQSALEAKVLAKSEKLQHMNAIFDGTVAFLLNEGFIRSDDDRNFQLTLKGFVHLNKRFERTGIQDGARYIDRLVDLLRPDKFTGAVSSGTLSSLIANIFCG